MCVRKVAVFDFDGTITTKDTLLEFIKYSCGLYKFYIGILVFSPILFLMKLNIYPNYKAKQKFFSWFFKGKEYTEFVNLGKSFSSVINKLYRESTIKCLNTLRAEGADIYVISASIEEWVSPYCSQLGVKKVICTKVDVKDGKLTGRFSTKNCYGKEKVNRLLEIEPNRSEYYLYAYGDSRGDKEMLEYADESVYIGKRE